MVPLPQLHDSDYGDYLTTPLVVTSFWQVLKIQGLSDTWENLEEFYSFLKIPGTLDMWKIARKLQALDLGELLSFKKWQEIRLALSEGHPVMIGGSAYSSLVDAGVTGLVPMPVKNEEVIGGFITTIFSHDAEEDFIKGLSSLGSTFGKEGTLLFRGSYMRNLLVCRDFFTFIPRIS